MKITKRQLKRVIREAKRKLLREQFTRASLNVSIETLDPEAQLPADINVLAHDLEQYLRTWGQSVGVTVSVSADYQS